MRHIHTDQTTLETTHMCQHVKHLVHIPLLRSEIQEPALPKSLACYHQDLNLGLLLHAPVCQPFPQAAPIQHQPIDYEVYFRSTAYQLLPLGAEAGPLVYKPILQTQTSRSHNPMWDSLGLLDSCILCNSFLSIARFSGEDYLVVFLILSRHPGATTLA